MTENEERQLVVTEAISWKGTNFVWEACIKGVGVDCGRYLAGVMNETKLLNIDISKLPRMSPQWFLHNETNAYINLMKQYGEEYFLINKRIPKPGDWVIAKYGRDWSHGAIVIEWPKVIGCASGYCVTIWNDIYKSPQFINRSLRFFDPWQKRVEL